MKLTHWTLALGLAWNGWNSIAQADEVFTFAGFTFDQRNAPDQAALLGNAATLGGAVFGAGLPTTTTLPLRFPQGGPGFDERLSLGFLTGLTQAEGVRAVNLPNGNDGVQVRHGLDLSWSEGRGLPNFVGPDFVVYESASASNEVEGIMVRVHRPQPDFWTDWYYQPPAAFQTTMNANVAHAFACELSDFGLKRREFIDRIQIANLTATDRIAGPGTDLGRGMIVGKGRVIFDSPGNVVPDAGVFDSNRVFDSSHLDPDPLYVAALHEATRLPNLVPTRKDGMQNDFNGDGMADVLFQTPEGHVAAWFMGGTSLLAPSFLNPSRVNNPHWSIAGTGDFNTDGKTDLMFQHRDGTLAVWHMEGIKAVASAMLTPNHFGNALERMMATGDFNHDGQEDLVLEHANGDLRVWLMKGVQLLRDVALNPGDPLPVDWNVAGAGDFNRDTQTDLLFQRADGSLAVWYMNGTQRLQAVPLNPSQAGDPQWRVAGVSDLDANGWPDVLFQHADGTLAAWILDIVSLKEARLLNPSQPGGAWRLVGPR